MERVAPPRSRYRPIVTPTAAWGAAGASGTTHTLAPLAMSVPRSSRVLVVLATVLSLVAAGCSSDPKVTSGSTTTAAGGAEGTTAGNGAGQAGKGCATPSKPDTMTAEAKELAPGGDGQPRVQAVVYPHPDYPGKLWTQWGQGVVLPDGRFFSAIGDECGVNGNSYFYEFSPDTGRLRLLSDVDSAVGQRDGAWGYGKVHAQLGIGPDNQIYAATYWGSSRGITYGNGYEGDLLLRIDPENGAVTRLAVPVAKHGIPSMTTWTAGGLLYGEAPDPLAAQAADAAATKEEKKAKKARSDTDTDAAELSAAGDAKAKPGTFFVYDIKAGKVVFTDDEAHVGYRNVAVGPKGVAYFSAGAGQLKRYDPAANRLDTLPAKLPGAYMRASTRPARDGTIYGVTRSPDRFFALRADGTIDDLGPARGYTTSMALDPAGDAFYYVPDAHGASWQQGAPLIRVDTKTGDQREIVKLNDLAVKQFQLRLGGTYNVAIDRSGERVYIGFNAGAPTAEDAFGSVVLVVVELPD